MNELALFAGAGGGILGGKLLGWRTVCAVELEPFARNILLARQRDGIFDPFPVWDDVCTFDGRPWRGHVDVVSGGFPCQDLSRAGTLAGLSGDRSSLWFEMARIISEVRPHFVFVENVPTLVSNGLNIVLENLATLGFDAEWGILSAAAVGAWHKRERLFIVAYANGAGLQGTGRERDEVSRGTQRRLSFRPSWPPEPDVCRMANGVPDYVDRIRSLGNAQIPRVAAAAWSLLVSRIGKRGTA